ncbi:hypothetical protein GCM10010400_17760 [Streptomyces aculeolatus]|uniref:peptidase inhibitor family I36 protein n=1 Tax=Streptomyces aculeolatus TaxID=270689 RepID=UPI001CED3E8D|nr:peptidase inhibitor family I36 protein [Streptomyces aculeolatus]
MRKILAALGTVGLAVALGPAVPAQASAADAKAWSCPSNSVCFYSGTGGQGQRCAWPARTDDKDWKGGDVQCSWASYLPNVRSVRVMPNSMGSVTYFSRAGYSNRVGCTDGGADGSKSTFFEAKVILSHKTSSSACQI